MIDEKPLLNFLQNWRQRLVKVPIERRADEQFGQLMTLNTIIAYLDDYIKEHRNDGIYDDILKKGNA